MPPQQRPRRKRGRIRAVASTAVKIAAPVASLLDPTLGLVSTMGAEIVQQTWGRSKDTRTYELAQDLTELLGTLDDRRLEDENLIQALVMTEATVRRTRNRDVRRLLAQLFAGYYQSARAEDIDEFEHVHRILADFAPRELYTLVIVTRLEQRRAEESLDSKQYLKALHEEVEKQLGIPEAEQSSYFARLNLVGLYTTRPLMGGPSELTPYMEKFRRALDLDSIDLSAQDDA
jgi:hypothetical protein